MSFATVWPPCLVTPSSWGQSVSSEEDNTVVDALVEECSSLNRVVTEFLQFARPETLRAVPFDMAGMARDLSRDLEPQANAAKVQLAQRHRGGVRK